MIGGKATKQCISTMVRTIADIIHPFSFTALAFNAISLVLAGYMTWIFMSHWSWSAFKQQVHYRLRCILCWLLVLNRSLHLTYQGIWMAFTVDVDRKCNGEPVSRCQPVWFWGGYMAFINMWQNMLFWWILLLFLFLTLNRFSRVKMILSGTWSSYTLVSIQLVLSLSVIFVCIINLIFTWADLNAIRGENVEHAIPIQLFWSMSDTTIAVTFFLGLILDYGFTIALIRLTLTTSIPDQSADALYPSTTKLHFRRKLIRWIAIWCSLIVVIDSLSIVLPVLSFRLDTNWSFYDRYEDLKAFSQSWVVVRAYSLFKLLDLFLIKIKDTKAHLKMKTLPLEKPETIDSAASLDVFSFSLSAMVGMSLYEDKYIFENMTTTATAESVVSRSRGLFGFKSKRLF